MKHNIQFREGNNGRFELTVGPKQTMGKTVRIFIFKIISKPLLFSLKLLLLNVQCQKVYLIVH